MKGRNIMTIFLCGFMGCGKSTIGKRLAVLSGRGFVDMDSYIEDKAGMTIPEIFEKLGEPAFREMETEAVRALSGAGKVVACGGGAMLKSINAEIAAEKGRIIYIEVDFETCYSRIEGDKNRPLVMKNTKEQLKAIYEERAPIYAAHATDKADGNESPETVARQIKELCSL